MLIFLRNCARGIRCVITSFTLVHKYSVSVASLDSGCGFEDAPAMAKAPGFGGTWIWMGEYGPMCVHKQCSGCSGGWCETVWWLWLELEVYWLKVGNVGFGVWCVVPDRCVMRLGWGMCMEFINRVVHGEC